MKRKRKEGRKEGRVDDMKMVVEEMGPIKLKLQKRARQEVK